MSSRPATFQNRKDVFPAALATMLVLVWLVAGCGKKSESSYTPPPNLDPAAQLEETLKELTVAAREYGRVHKSIPTTFREFALAAKLRIPMEPPGKMFFLNTNPVEVSLVNRR